MTANCTASTTTTTGVVLSSASSMVGPIVTPTSDPWGLKATIEAAQPGIEVTPVWDDGNGWLSTDGFTPDQIIARYS